jgi:hemerythrin HHE cation binding domain-containing protein
MMNKPLPSRALAELAGQHAILHDMIDRCEELADALDVDRIDPDVLLREVARLRIALDAHNRYEEQLLPPLLLDADWLGAVRVSRMVEDHIVEHRAMRSQLGSAPSSELRATLASLRAHLDSEEHDFLTRRVLRDDLAG